VPVAELGLQPVHPRGLGAKLGHLVLELVLLFLEVLGLLALALTRVVGGEAVALDALNASLLLLVLGLGSLAGRQAGLGFWENLAPRLPLLNRLAF
jgi:hypothetical protein